MASSSSSSFHAIRHLFESSEKNSKSSDDRFKIYLRYLDMDSSKIDFTIYETIKFVIFVETVENLERIISHIKQIIPQFRLRGINFRHVSETTGIATMTCGSILCVSFQHGFDVDMLPAVFHEIMKLLECVSVSNPIFFLLGTSGGIGIEPGNIVVTSDILTIFGEGVDQLSIDGEKDFCPCFVSQIISNQLTYFVGHRFMQDFPPIRGKTLSAHGFYEGLEKLEGSIDEYVKQKKLSYLKEMMVKKVYNVNNFSARFASLCNEANVKVAIICITMVDLLKDAEITVSKVHQEVWMDRAFSLIALFIKEKIMGRI